MSTDEGTYAPKSPDLSSFFSSGPESAFTSASASASASAAQPQPTSAPNPALGPAPGSSSSLSGYQPQPHAPPHPSSSTASTSTSTLTQPQPHPGSGLPYGQPQPPQPHQHYHHNSYSSDTYNNFDSYSAQSPGAPRPLQQQPYFPPQQPHDQYGQSPLQAQQLGYAISPPISGHGGPQPYYSAYTDTQPNQYQPLPAQTHLPPAYDRNSAVDPASPMPPRKSAAAQAAQQPEIMESPVRTKFPTARIKRIMQADEEVGKVAQQTPIAVGKALELFMVQIVTKSADVAKEKNSKRISAQMLKHAVATNPQWDFLQDIVAKVSEKEDAAKASKAKQETDSDEDPDAEPKKKARGGRKKKAAS
ncbi:hypothetical protein JX266_000827 [Neoarthrinium moseri]|nr:hypothetical protein JX266_000827 [Neoarthrinium moseri]